MTPSRPSVEPMLRVEGLGVSYGALRALQDVSWQVHAGEILGLIGPNGAGKSTCFEAVTNMVTREGKVFLDGIDVSNLPAWQLSPKGLKRTFQQNAFFGNMPLIENVTGMLLRSRGTSLPAAILMPWLESRRRSAVEQLARELLVRFGVPPELHDLRPGEIPYGTQRMLSVALACAGGAKVILLDEPAAGLGGADMKRLRDLLISLRNEGMALVVIEHHMDLIMATADRIVVLDRGRMLASGTAEDVRNNDQVLEAYLGRAA